MKKQLIYQVKIKSNKTTNIKSKNKEIVIEWRSENEKNINQLKNCFILINKGSSNFKFSLRSLAFVESYRSLPSILLSFLDSRRLLWLEYQWACWIHGFAKSRHCPLLVKLRFFGLGPREAFFSTSPLLYFRHWHISGGLSWSPFFCSLSKPRRSLFHWRGESCRGECEIWLQGRTCRTLLKAYLQF